MTAQLFNGTAKPTVAVLFARQDSIYKTMPQCDVYDIDRDARTWPGGLPVVAHPPCRAWASLRNFAKPRPDEKELATWAIDKVRQFGGVLEHPLRSTLWAATACARPGERDRWGGWCLPVWQSWWGHRAEKASIFYIVGSDPCDIPELPLVLGHTTHCVSPASGLLKGMPGWRPHLRKDEREHSPPALAAWLVQLAASCRVQTMRAAA